MKSQNQEYLNEKEENRRTANILSVLIWASWVVFLFIIFAGFYFQDGQIVAVTLAGCALLVVPFVLIRRGNIAAGSFIVVLIVLGIVTILAVIGQGIRDLAILAFPVIIIFAGLTLSRVLYRISVGLSLAVIAGLVVGEYAGWYVTKPLVGAEVNWFYLAAVSLILLTAALAVDLLITNMRKDLELARLEFEQRKRADDNLEESEAKYRFLVNHTSDDIVRLDQNCQFIFVSESASHFHGYEPRELLNTSGAELVHPDDRAANYETMKVILGAGLPSRAEYRIRRKDGTYMWVEAAGSRVYNQAGNPEVILVQRDITERKLAETHNRVIAEIQDILLHPDQIIDVFPLVSEKVKALIGEGIVATSILDERHKTLQMGSCHGIDIPMEKVASILGFDPFEKKFSLESIPEEDLRIYRSGRLGVLNGGLYSLMTRLVPQPACLLVEKILRVQKIYAMGFIHHEEHMGSLIILARSDITPHIAAIEQIVNLASIAIERKHAEEEAKNSAKRFHVLVENGRDNISLLAKDGTLLWESPSAKSTLGYGPNQFVGSNIFSIIHPDDQPWTLEMYTQVLQSPGAIREGEFRLRHADGSWRWIECSAANMLEEPSVQAIVLNYRDITEHKRAEDALIVSEERFKLSMDATQDGLWDWDIRTGKGYFSPGWYRMLGYEAGDFPMESNAWESLIHPDDRDHAYQVNLDCIEGRREQFEVEYRMKTKNGDWRWILGRGKCVARDPQGRALRLLGTHMDITERKQTEEALREKEVQYRNLADSGTALIWRAGTDKLCKYFNLPWLKFTGRTLEQEMGNGWVEGVHPDDVNRCFETYAAAFDKREAFDMEYRLRHNSGEYRWIQDLGTPNYNSNHEFVGYIGHCFDITERKRLEEQFRHQSNTDSMTGIFNRNFFEDELARFERGREFPVSIVIADIDRLKYVNDHLGHAAGDELLRQAAMVLSSVFRAGDVLARIGGDEFGALLPATDAAAVEQIVARIRKRLEEHNYGRPGLPLQLSIGAATAMTKNLAEVFTLADQRMYAEKSSRRSGENEIPVN
jgi:diguanylate cyclase (GGDEF)-like protein/PAS domain S-box-containing protein